MSSRSLEGALAFLLFAGCRTEQPPEERQLPPRLGSQLRVQTSGIHAGAPTAPAPLVNPYEGNVHALQDGKRLYLWFNCAGCHGEIGGGSIGPPLRDAEWIYGGQPQNIYQSIVQGRPQGMPAFADRIGEDDLWKLVAFVQSLGGTVTKKEEGAPASTGTEGAER